MAGDLTGCAALKKSKSKGSDKDSANKRENGDSTSKPTTVMQTTRGGLRVYKIVILGDGGVGKSAVTLQFVSHSFLDYHDPTIEDSYQQQAVIDGEAALLDILDTAGQVEFTAMRDQYMRCGEGFIICYSVTDRHSFQEASEYRKLITRVRLSEDIPLVLIANKLDLEMHRKVSTEEGRNLASQFGCPFYETSAALRHYIDDAFYSLVREIRRKEQQRHNICLQQRKSNVLYMSVLKEYTGRIPRHRAGLYQRQQSYNQNGAEEPQSRQLTGLLETDRVRRK